MARLKSLAILLIILLSHVPLAKCGSITEYSPNYSVSKMYARKLLMEISVDYDFGGPNTRHDPRRERPPGGRRNI